MLFTKAERIMIGLVLTVQREQQWYDICAFKLCDIRGRAYQLPSVWAHDDYAIDAYPRNFPYSYFDVEDAAYILMALLNPKNTIPKDIGPFLSLMDSVTPDVSL